MKLLLSVVSLIAVLVTLNAFKLSAIGPANYLENKVANIKITDSVERLGYSYFSLFQYLDDVASSISETDLVGLSQPPVSNPQNKLTCQNEAFFDIMDPIHMVSSNNLLRSPPTTSSTAHYGPLSAFLSGKLVLSNEQENWIAAQWKRMKHHGSIRHLDDADNVKLIAALRICFVALWQQLPLQKAEFVSSRARGIASVLGEIKAPVDVVLAGLLHEVVAAVDKTEDVSSLAALVDRFGADTIELCRDYNQLPQFLARAAHYTVPQSQTQLEMLISMMENYYCLYIRLAEKVHTMRDLKNLPITPYERQKLAEEARYVYAPLAGKMNLLTVKSELEDLSLKYLEPEMFVHCRKAQNRAYKIYQNFYDKIRSLIDNDPKLSRHSGLTKVTYRIKGKYQLYEKMWQKELRSPSLVRDAVGIRFILNPQRILGEEDAAYQMRCQSLCYYVLQQIRNISGWEGSDEELKDFIKYPKPNGYQCIHQYLTKTTTGTQIDVQIRTRTMHLQAEVGSAAHWSYKDEIFRPELSGSKLYKATWRSPEQVKFTSVMEIIRLAHEYLQSNRVFVFVDNQSEVLNLPREASVLDAAFRIHPSIGLAAESICLDGKPVTKSAAMTNGQVLSVTTNANLSVLSHVDALTTVRTSYARNEIKEFLRDNHPQAVLCLGIMQLMMFVTFNQEVFYEKVQAGGNWTYSGDAWHLQRMVHTRLQKPMDVFLKELGVISSKQQFRAIMSEVLHVPARTLRAMTALDIGLIWARMQGAANSSGWIDETAKNRFLLPLLDEILPSLGYTSMRAEWCELIGAQSLTQAPSVEADNRNKRYYYSSSHKSEKEKPNARPLFSLPRTFSNQRLHRSTHVSTVACGNEDNVATASVATADASAISSSFMTKKEINSSQISLIAGLDPIKVAVMALRWQKSGQVTKAATFLEKHLNARSFAH